MDGFAPGVVPDDVPAGAVAGTPTAVPFVTDVSPVLAAPVPVPVVTVPLVNVALPVVAMLLELFTPVVVDGAIAGFCKSAPTP